MKSQPSYARMISLWLIAVIFLFSGCEKLFDKDEDDPNNEPQEPPFPTLDIYGKLFVADGSTLQPDDLNITSFIKEQAVNNDGTFNVPIINSQKFQVVFFQSKVSGNPVYIGLYDPVTSSLNASDTSTALVLTLFNPYLIFANQYQLNNYFSQVKSNSKFDMLLEELRQAYEQDAETALNDSIHPTIYQLTVELMKESLESLGMNRSRYTGNPPYIEDVAGPDIKFVNNRHVFYGSGIYQQNTTKDVITINRKTTLVSFQLGWPPAYLTEPKETIYNLGDGSYRIFLSKGFDFTQMMNFNSDPKGRATVLNCGQGILYIIEILLGHLPLPELATLPNHFHISYEKALQLSADIAQKNTQGFLTHFFGLIMDNSEELAYWIYQEVQSNAAHHFIQSAAGIFKKCSLVLEILGYINEQGPFFWDLILAPADVTYFITQQNGVITETTTNNAPLAEFTIDPPAGIVTTNFYFDASTTTDDLSSLEELEFRWDFEGNGDWTAWSDEYTATHTYPSGGTYHVFVEARDSDGLMGSIMHVLNIGGGAGTATHVKLFMDVLPWDSDAMEEMLQNLGFSYGTGSYEYEIISSDEMSSVDLIPGEDLVIISNDQPQSFYNNYATSQVKFTNFVYMGGSLFWEACDEGWADGSIEVAGIELPGNIEMDLDIDGYNFITNPLLPLVMGLPQMMDHNYASHESFSGYPDGAIVYCENSYDRATLLEFNLGGGWVMITGQPLEHQYEGIYGNPDMEELLPRIVSYFTGMEWARNPVKTIRKAVKASYNED